MNTDADAELIKAREDLLARWPRELLSIVHTMLLVNEMIDRDTMVSGPMRERTRANIGVICGTFAACVGFNADDLLNCSLEVRELGVAALFVEDARNLH